MLVRRIWIVMLALAVAGLAPACKKSTAAGPAVADVAAESDAPEPPPPPPALVEKEIDVKGWKIALSLPETFLEVEGEAGLFTEKGESDAGAALTISTGCAGECGKQGWLARAEKIFFDIVASFNEEDSNGNPLPATVNLNRKVGEGRYQFELLTPKGEGMLAEQSYIGGVYVFNDEWEAYVACQFTSTMEVAPTFKDALADACKSMRVVSAPPAAEPPPPPPPPPPADTDAGVPTPAPATP